MSYGDNFILTNDGVLILALDHKLDASGIDLPTVSGATYETVEDYVGTAGDSGLLSGGVVTDDADGTVTVGVMAGMIYTTPSYVGSLVFFDLAQDTTLTMQDGALNYIYAQYNAGTPRYQVTTLETDISGSDEFVVALVWRSGTEIHIANVGKHIDQFNQQIYRHAFYIDGLERMWGLLTTENGTRQLDVTQGGLSWALHELPIAAKTAGSFKLFYNDGSWQEGSAITTVPNTQYNDYGTGLTDLTANRYGVYWIYLVIDGDMYGVYGVGDYVLAQALAAESPANLPPELANIGILIAKIIVQKSATNFYSITIPWDTAITGSAATDHGSLAGLADQADHAYAVTIDGSRSMTGQWDMGAQLIGINETINTGMTVGLTINQGAAGDQILAFKSSEVAHGVTVYAETDTYAFMKKISTTLGGLSIWTFAETGLARAFEVIATATDDDTSKDVNSFAPIVLNAGKKDGTSIGDMGANANLVVMQHNLDTRWILDEDGDTWQSGKIHTYHGASGQAAPHGYTRILIEDDTHAAISFLTPNNVTAYILFGDPEDAVKGQIYYEHANDALAIKTAGIEHLRLDSSGQLFLSETANASMTKGITINQGSSDNEILAFKSSDVAHGYTSLCETDTYGFFQKQYAAQGGLSIYGVIEDVGVYTALGLLAYGGTAQTGKTSSDVGLISLYASEISGNAMADVTANGNIVAMRARKSGAFATVWILDEDGDTWQPGRVTAQELGFIDGGSAVDIIRDEDNMSSDDAAALATQQSIKAYVDALSIDSKACVVFAERSSAQSISSSVETKIDHDSIPIDRNSHYDSTDDRVIATEAGVYLAFSTVTWDAIAGNRAWNVSISKNGTSVAKLQSQSAITGTNSNMCVWIGALAVDDYIEHWTVHANGSSRNTKSPWPGGTVFAVVQLYAT